MNHEKLRLMLAFFASGCCCSRIWLRFKGISFFCFVFTKKYDYEEKEEVVGAKGEEVVIKGIIFLLPRMTSLSKFKLFIRDEMTLEKKTITYYPYDNSKIYNNKRK